MRPARRGPGCSEPGNGGANIAADHVTVFDRALAEIRAEHVESLEILVGADRAGGAHELAGLLPPGQHALGRSFRHSAAVAIIRSVRCRSEACRAFSVLAAGRCLSDARDARQSG
jgi:hypothetical protein